LFISGDCDEIIEKEQPMQSSSVNINTSGIPLLGSVCIVIFALGMLVLALFIWGNIFSKAGYSFWFCLLMIVPLANLIWLIIFAFSYWPIQRELDMYRAQSGRTGGFPVGPPLPPR
jgi:hypothetical protein